MDTCLTEKWAQSGLSLYKAAKELLQVFDVRSAKNADRQTLTGWSISVYDKIAFEDGA